MKRTNNSSTDKKTVIITFKITDELKRQLETICYYERVSQTALIERLIANYHQKLIKKTPDPAI